MNKIKARSEVDNKYKWDLSLIYSGLDEFNDDYIEVLSGLREGHKVITKGKEFVSIDEKVNIVGGVEK